MLIAGGRASGLGRLAKPAPSAGANGVRRRRKRRRHHRPVRAKVKTAAWVFVDFPGRTRVGDHVRRRGASAAAAAAQITSDIASEGALAPEPKGGVQSDARAMAASCARDEKTERRRRAEAQATVFVIVPDHGSKSGERRFERGPGCNLVRGLAFAVAGDDHPALFLAHGDELTH